MMKAMLIGENRNLVWSGAIRPSVYKVLPMAQAEEAHDILYRRENVGEVVLRVEEE